MYKMNVENDRTNVKNKTMRRVESALSTSTSQPTNAIAPTIRVWTRREENSEWEGDREHCGGIQHSIIHHLWLFQSTFLITVPNIDHEVIAHIAMRDLKWKSENQCFECPPMWTASLSKS